MSTTSQLDTASALRALVESAVLAPSSHNTQPWVFRIDGERLELHADRTRALPVNDPQDRELTMSCGAAWFNARLAAAHAGLSLRVEVLPDGQAGDLLFAARLDGGVPERGLPPFGAIAKRRTYRKHFAERPAPDDVLAALHAAVSAEGAELTVLDDTARPTVVSLVTEGDRLQFADARWRRELAAWMHPRRKGEGLLVSELAAPVARFVVSHIDVGKSTAGKDHELAERSPVLAAISTAADAPAAWLNAGQALQRLLLVACDAGLQASYLNQPLQVEALRPRVAELLGGDRAPQLLLRLGYPTGDLPAAPRRPVDAVMEE
jgi:nitroreductase